MHIVIEEQLTILVENDGGLDSLLINGGLSINTNDTSLTDVNVCLFIFIRFYYPIFHLHLVSLYFLFICLFLLSHISSLSRSLFYIVSFARIF